MKNTGINWLHAAIAASLITGSVAAATDPVSDEEIKLQRAMLAKATNGAGFSPQSPRDIDAIAGINTRIFEAALNLCNIHMHVSAEHKGGQFTRYIGNGNGKGYGTGFAYDGKLTDAELAAFDMTAGEGKGGLKPGDTIEVHYVHTTAQVTPGPTLGACLSESFMNPQLRVETQVFVVVNDDSALNFMELTEVGKINGLHQTLDIPSDGLSHSTVHC